MIGRATQRTDWMARIGFRDLEFARVPVQRYSTAGTPYVTWEPIGMPKLPQKNLDTAFYLYGSVEDAKAGVKFGGTGFLVVLPSEKYPNNVSHTYGITNWHVACRDGASVIRLNTKDGGTDILEFSPDQWEFDTRYDIAAIPLAHSAQHKATFVGREDFVTKEVAQRIDLGVGENVFMIGRFIDHDGGATNRPAARFGNISVMPAPIEQATGKTADCYCIDLHSRSGYSGSPVFVYRTPGYDLGEIVKDGEPRKVMLAGVNFLGLLGIHFGQFPELWEVEDKKRLAEAASKEPLLTEGKYIKGLSGMTCVLPAWCILEVLDMPKFKKQRAEGDMYFEEKYKREGFPPEAESQAKADTHSSHREDFKRLLGAAVKKKADG